MIYDFINTLSQQISANVAGLKGVHRYRGQYNDSGKNNPIVPPCVYIEVEDIDWDDKSAQAQEGMASINIHFVGGYLGHDLNPHEDNFNNTEMYNAVMIYLDKLQLALGSFEAKVSVGEETFSIASKLKRRNTRNLALSDELEVWIIQYTCTLYDTANWRYRFLNDHQLDSLLIAYADQVVENKYLIPHVDSDGSVVELPPGEIMVCTPPDIIVALTAADFNIEEQANAAAGNATLVPNVTDRVAPLLSNITMMNAVIDAYFARIGSTNEALKNNVRSQLLRIAREPLAFESFYNSVTYLMWPESEAMGIVPLFDLRTDSITEDRLQKFNTPTFSASLGVSGNGIDSTFYIPFSTQRMGRVYPADRILAWLNLTKVATGTMYMGVLRTTSASFMRTQSPPGLNMLTYIGNSQIRWDSTTIGSKLLSFGATKTGQNQFDGLSDINNEYHGEHFQDGDYVNPVQSVTTSKPTMPADLNATSFYYFNFNGYQSVAISGAPNPVLFSDQGIGGISFWVNRSRSANALISDVLDQIQLLFGRTI